MATILQVRPSSQAASTATADTIIVGGGSLVGRRIGSYTVLGELGQGGMGCVYLAEHALIGRKAAIKVLNPDISADPEVVSRFFTEARAVNDIRHPNIVEVTDFGQFGSLYCIVMEFLEGETLAARLTRIRTFDETAVVRIMKQCTSALGAAHEQGLVHRDIKPENIFLRAHPDYPDFVKVLDFGIAKLLGTDSSVGHHTKTGSVLGTPSYMSPEQCLGEADLDIRSDVYSLGVVIYQMLTGVLPFTADTLGRLIVCHVNEAPVPPSVMNAAVSRPMNDLVLRAMQKNPKDRYQSARDMREALERVLAPHARSSSPRFGVKVPGGWGKAPAPARPGHSGQFPAAHGGATANLRPAGPAGAPENSDQSGHWPRAQPARQGAAPAGGMAGGAAGTPGKVARPSASDGLAGDPARRLIDIVLERIAAGQIELPELSPATIRCLDLAASGRLGFTDAANIINEQPAMRSRVMRLANSAAFPSKMPATTLETAVGRLGTQGLYTALIEFAARETLEGRQPRVKEVMRRAWPHALGTAVMSSELCHALGRPNQAANAYLTGLLWNVGKPIVGSLLLAIEEQMHRAGNRSPMPEFVLLAAMEGAAHMAGGAVARHWELAGAVADAIEQSRAWNPHEPHAISNIARFAGLLTYRLGLTVGLYNGPEVERAFNEGRAVLKVDETALKRITHGFKERTTVLAGIRGG